MFGRKTRKPAADRLRLCTTPDGVIVWVVGDIHGQDDLFDSLSGLISADLGAAGDARRQLVLLGDYIDRGVGSRAVVERVIGLRQTLEADRIEVVALKGNHEALLLRFLDDPSSGPSWMAVGGFETLLSYGVKAPSTSDEPGWIEASEALAAALPPAHLEFFRGLRLSHIEGDYFFVHAGVRPGVALQDQSEQDMLWIREAFLRDERPFDRLIIHGHTPGEDVYADDRRICLDTGSYATGVLSALRLQARTHLLVQTRRNRDRVRLQSRPLLND